MRLFGPKRSMVLESTRDEGFAITISSTTGSRVFQFHLSRRLAGWLAGAAILLLLLIASGLAGMGYLLREAHANRQLRAENLHMQRQLARMVELEGQVARIDSTRRALLRVVGVEEPAMDQVLAADDRPSQPGPSPTYRAVKPSGEISEEDLEEARALVRQRPLEGPVTRVFGPIGETGVFHAGIDIAGETGAPVCAAGDGIVTFVGTDEVFGLVLVIAHGPNIASMYGHNDNIQVQVGDFVTGGQEVAEVGNTGRSSAPHLHFETHINGKAVDPAAILTEWLPVDVPADGDGSQARSDGIHSM